MRRSKSNPAKYARNYRSISQRHMTKSGDDDDGNGEYEKSEIQRLRQVLRDSEVRLTDAPDYERTDEKCKRKREKTTEPSIQGENKNLGHEAMLSQEIAEQYIEGDIPILFSSSKRQRKPKQQQISLTPHELRQAKMMQKNVTRKLKQLELRAEQKTKRKMLYDKLQQNALSHDERELLLSSSTLGKKVSKREHLKRLLKKQRAGLQLSGEEEQLLYSYRTVAEFKEAGDSHYSTKPLTVDTEMMFEESEGKELGKKLSTIDSMCMNQSIKTSNVTVLRSCMDNILQPDIIAATSVCIQSFPDDDTKSQQIEAVSSSSQMMASLAKLKENADAQADAVAETKEKDERCSLEKLAANPSEKYVPKNSVVLKTAASLGLSVISKRKENRKVIEIERSESIKVLRNDLPVSAMEFEVMDAIRNNDVTIICGETGCGKSTQIPQFLYEDGITLHPDSDEHQFVIGVTQPRRVAAVSTAKRVCYELGRGNGATIPNDGEGNLVAYQTRYENAGLGKKNCIKFMTDGILLQEIQSDLLLRNYSVIVLDEAHERNLNTDVLIGMLAASISLRKQASQEPNSQLVALKLVIMSATLRVEDFSSNNKLFSSCSLAVVKIPGRTYPVTIHYSKVTELDNYEDVAFEKVCKIHRKLPRGGILVFLTGKHEILRMVKRLRRALSMPQTSAYSNTDVADYSDKQEDFPRDLDDDDFDGEVQDEQDMDITYNDTAYSDNESANDSMPTQTVILPLYSLLNADEQAKVFAPVPDDYRLIVIATNIAETSITIPGISYVVDTGRHKCRNYKSGTGVASYDIMWISQAAADQRAGRAGRTGPGHCYRLYSSSVYSRQFDAYALPEILIRPLEDVVLAMKAMKISNISEFRFPTPPDHEQVKSALEILANIGCIDLSNNDTDGCDGKVTQLGIAISKLPLGVRYGKILLVAAEADVLDYAIAMVASLSELSPFVLGDSDADSSEEAITIDEEDNKNTLSKAENTVRKFKQWSHRGGDILAATLAIGAYSFAGRGAGGISEAHACKKFCQENGLNAAIMLRIHRTRMQLAKLAKVRLSFASGIAAKSGGVLSSMPPPNAYQEHLLRQAILSGLLDNVALLAPPGSLPRDRLHKGSAAYLSCSTKIKEPLFMDQNSVVFSRDSRLLPQWICFDSLIRKVSKNGDPFVVMKKITPIEVSWLGDLAAGSNLLRKTEDPLAFPAPIYDSSKDSVMCFVATKYGCHGWEIPPVKVEMFTALQVDNGKQKSNYSVDDSFRWFARFLFEGKVLSELEGLKEMLNDSPSVITYKVPLPKVGLLVSALSGAGVDSASALRKHWAEINDKFLFSHLKHWIKPHDIQHAKTLWISAVKQNISHWNQLSIEKSAT